MEKTPETVDEIIKQVYGPVIAKQLDDFDRIFGPSLRQEKLIKELGQIRCKSYHYESLTCAECGAVV